MAYQNISYVKETNLIHLWDDVKGYSSFPYNHYGFVQDEIGQFTALDGKRVRKTTDYSELNNSDNLYESDINPELRTLIDLYYQDDTISKDHREMFFDIEVKSDDGFPMPDDADQEITGISFYYKPMEFYCSFILDTKHQLTKSKVDNKVVIPCATEKQLLIEFYKQYTKIQPTIISGWNSNWFDVPYLYNRTVKILGRGIANQLSPINVVKWSTMNRTYKIYGVSHLDYLYLYKKFTQNERSMYSLDYICKEEIGEGKIQYEGTLNTLLEEDINKFLEYNLNDVILMVKLDKKMDFIEITRGVCHKGHVPYEDIFMPSRYIDGSALVYLKKHNIIATNKQRIPTLNIQRNHSVGEYKIYCDDTIDTKTPLNGQLRFWKSKSVHYDYNYINYEDNYFILEKPLENAMLKIFALTFHFEGAFVQEPIPGLYEWIFDLDLTSMYPSNIMTLNISPETKMGRVLEYNRDALHKQPNYIFKVQYKNKIKSMTSKDVKEFLKENKYSLASNGVFYRTDIKGLIPAILETWFNERKEYSGLAEKYGKEKNDVLYKKYDALQHVVKIMLNSFYGVLGLTSFRFYDLENAEAVTISGQFLIKFSSQMANYYSQQELGVTNSNTVIYTDTDSIFFRAIPIVQHRYPDVDLNDRIQMSKYILEVASDVQNFINESYDLYAKKFHFVDTHKWIIKQELIAMSGFWVAKKRYAQWIINKKGVPCDKLDVKGIDVVRSNFPKEFRTFMEAILKDILHKVQKPEIDKTIFALKDKLNDFDAINIMFPVGTKDMSEHKNEVPFKFRKGTPAHYKAALSYNDLLEHFKYNSIPPISDGDKIKWTYLRQNPYGLESLALKGFDDPPKIVEIVEKYMDRMQNFDSVLLNKLNDFYSALGWGVVPNSDKIADFFDV